MVKKWTDEYPFKKKSDNVIISIELWETIINEHNRLAELEDKIEQGTLKFLQCKVGDKVYFIDEKKWCWEMVVAEIAILKKHIVYKIGNGRKELRYVYDEDLGKKWFLTKAEAEQKLEKLQNERN